MGYFAHVELLEAILNLVCNLCHPVMSEVSPVDRPWWLALDFLRIPLLQGKSRGWHALDHFHVVSEDFTVALIVDHFKRDML